MVDAAPPSRAFVLGLADHEGHLDGAALYELGASIGFTDTTIRLTVRRLVEAGLVESSGRGRSSTLQLTPAGVQERAPDLGWTALAYRLDSAAQAWDGRWHLVAFEIPEAERAGRDALRAHLVDLFGAPLGGGLYVSPREWEPWVGEMATLHDIGRHVSTMVTDRLRVGGETDPRSIAASLWPLDEVGVGTRDFVTMWEPLVSDPPRLLGDAARAAFTASIEFETLARRDPLLPHELEPPDWAGRAARRVYRDLLDALGSKHRAIESANVFAAFVAAVDETSSMTDGEFGQWLWRATRPQSTERG
ncbi:MAG: PaaX family transcriptional regulator C-terminal domain-containing protein [Actinomycetota bacterium]